MRTFWRFNLIACGIVGVIILLSKKEFSDSEFLMVIMWMLATLLGNTIIDALDELKKGSIIKIEIKEQTKNKQRTNNFSK